MHVHRFVRFVKTFAIGLGISALSGGASPYVLAQGAAHQHERRDADQKHTPAALVATVREATERFKNVAAAEAEGYGLQFGCVTGPDAGAMGLHYVNFPLVLDGELDPTKPEIVIYEPVGNGKVKMIGADFLVLADAWHATHTAPPELMGQLLHYFEAPNRFGLPPFYTLHVWAWKENPTGMFVNWHSNVTCDAFAGKND
jgi:hypothetical protein